jgi:hypothetical protein
LKYFFHNTPLLWSRLNAPETSIYLNIFIPVAVFFLAGVAKHTHLSSKNILEFERCQQPRVTPCHPQLCWQLLIPLFCSNVYFGLVGTKKYRYSIVCHYRIYCSISTMITRKVKAQEVSYEELPQLSFDEFSDDYVMPMPFEDEYSQWIPYEY